MVRLPLVAVFAFVVLLLSTQAALASARPGFFGCRTYVAKLPARLVGPRSIVVACGDGNFYLTGIRWSAWTTERADGRATAHVNDCTPYCAAGHFHAYAAAITLSQPHACKGARVFTEIAWRFSGTKPHGAPRSGTTDFDCR